MLGLRNGFFSGVVSRKCPEVSPQSNNTTSHSGFVEKFRGAFAGMTLPTVAARIKNSIQSLASYLRCHLASKPEDLLLLNDSISTTHSVSETPSPVPVTDQKTYWGSVNIGVTGAELTGKSSLINALCGRLDTDQDGAAVTENGSRVLRGSYADKISPTLVYQEFPELSQSTHQKDLLKCEVVYHALGDRLLKSDVEMIRFLQKNNKPFFLVRMKCDLAVQQVQRQEKDMSTDRAEQRLRCELPVSLRKNNLNIADANILFVSSWTISEGKNAFDGGKMQGMSNDQRGKAQRSEAPGLSQLSPGQKPALPVKPASVSFAPNNSWLYSNPTPPPQGLGVGSSSELVSPTWQGEVVSQKPTPRKPLTDYFYAPFRQ